MDESRRRKLWPWLGAVHFAVQRCDLPFLRRYIELRTGACVSEEKVARWLRNPAREMWSDASWTAWFKRRAEEDGYFPIGRQSTVGLRMTCPLHCFFLYLEETPDMLALLRNEPKEQAKPQTPGIERTAVLVQPIDRVAARVVGTD